MHLWSRKWWLVGGRSRTNTDKNTNTNTNNMHLWSMKLWLVAADPAQPTLVAPHFICVHAPLHWCKNRLQYKYKSKAKTQIQRQTQKYIQIQSQGLRLCTYGKEQGSLPVHIILFGWTLLCRARSAAKNSSSSLTCGLLLKISRLLKKVRADAAEEADWLIGWQAGKRLRASSLW